MEQQVSLEEFLFKEEPEQKESRFKIENEAQADWAIRKYKEAQKQIEEYKQQRNQMLEKIDEWFKDATKEHQSTMDYMKFLLQEYHQKQLKKNPNLKTIKRPLGTLKAVTRKKWEWEDEEQLAEWLEKNKLKDFYEKTIKPRKSEIKKMKLVGEKVITPDGEVIPYVKVREETTFDVK